LSLVEGFELVFSDASKHNVLGSEEAKDEVVESLIPYSIDFVESRILLRQ
jgi:hypothetical protein